MAAQPRYWVCFDRDFAYPLAPSIVDQVAVYFGNVQRELLTFSGWLDDPSVSLSDVGGISLSGVVRASDSTDALAIAREAFNKALLLAGDEPHLPPAQHAPDWKAHELLGAAVPTVQILSAA